MSTIDDALVSRASGFAGLTALIGSAPMRLYPIGAASQNSARPYVTYQLISGPRVHAMGSDPGVAHPRFQFSCWDDTSTGARNVADQVRTCYSRFRGILLGVDILDVFVDDEHDLGREPDTRYYQRAVDLLIWHRE